MFQFDSPNFGHHCWHSNPFSSRCHSKKTSRRNSFGVDRGFSGTWLRICFRQHRRHHRTDNKQKLPARIVVESSSVVLLEVGKLAWRSSSSSTAALADHASPSHPLPVERNAFMKILTLVLPVNPFTVELTLRFLRLLKPFSHQRPEQQHTIFVRYIINYIVVIYLNNALTNFYMKKQADNSSTCLVPDFVHSIAAQLCQAPQLVAFRQLLLSDPHLQSLLSLKECIANPHSSFVNGILEPLSSLKRSGEEVNIDQEQIEIDQI